MFVCICNAIREGDLRSAAQRCPGNAAAVYESLGKRPNCGKCLLDVDQVVKEARNLGDRAARAA